MKPVGIEEALALTESWSISYCLTERDSGHERRNMQMSWQNRTPDQILGNLNAFLVAAGAPLKVVAAE